MNQNEFKDEYDRTLNWIRGDLEAFPWEDRQVYANWCAQTYYYVCHSTRLLALSAGLLPMTDTKMHYRFVSHISEETSHEKLAMKDVENLGFKVARFPELTETRSFYQTQYHQIQHIHSMALMGYIFMLEGAATDIGPSCYRRVVKAHGEKCANFWRVHAEEDPDHIRQAFQAIENAGSETLRLIATNMMDSAGRYLSICKACVVTTSVRKAV